MPRDKSPPDSALDKEALQEHVLHLPKPGDLTGAAAERCRRLEGVRYLMVVGSPRRARRIAELAHERFGARHDADGGFHSGYDKAVLAASEVLPPELALEAIRADAAL